MEAIEPLIEAAMGTLHLAEPLPDDVEERLYAFGREPLNIVLRPEALAFHLPVQMPGVADNVHTPGR